MDSNNTWLPRVLTLILTLCLLILSKVVAMFSSSPLSETRFSPLFVFFFPKVQMLSCLPTSFFNTPQARKRLITLRDTGSDMVSSHPVFISLT